MSYKSFAVAGGIGGGKPGSANIGNLIVKNLLKYPGVKVTVLARPESANTEAAKELESLGATIAPVDYTSPESLISALGTTQVLISTLTTTALPVQSALVDAVASGKTGVRLFVPSEFGNDTTKVEEESPLFVKRKVQLQLEEKGVPYTLFITGPFAEWVAAFAGPDEKGKITIVGSGEELVSFTAITDAARFIAHILATKPPSELANAIYRIQGSTATFSALSALYHAKSPTPLEVTYETPEEARKRFKEHGDFIAFLKAEWATGGGLVGEPVRNGEWPEWGPRDVREFV